MAKKTLTQAAFLKRVRDTIAHYGMLEKGDRVLVAVSGGADSVCLLWALNDLSKKLGIDLVVANMDHCLRGAESEAESRFVKEMASSMGISIRQQKARVPARSAGGGSLEERARKERYSFFKKAASSSKCNVIATGHTMDDQAETVLMRLIYGSSLAGMSGIYPVRHEGSYRLIRPLLRITRQDVEAFLKGRGVRHVEDSSNTDTRFLRNKVRHQILPFLEGYNPSLRRSLSNLSDSLREDHIFLESQKKKTVDRYGKAVSIKMREILLQPTAIRKDVLKEMFRRSGGDLKKLTHRHWMDMNHFIRSSNKGGSLDLPGGISVKKRAEDIIFIRK